MGLGPYHDDAMTTSSSSTYARLTLGILCTVLAFLAVAVMSAFAKAASDTGISAGVLVFFQNAISLVLLLPWVLRGGVAGLKTHRPVLHFIRAVAGLLSQYLLFVALKYIPLVDAVLLANAAPLFIPLITWAWLKQAISAKLWASLVIGFVGIVLILQPGGEVFSWATPLALAAGGCSALALVAVGLLDTTEPPARILVYYFLLSSVLTAPLLIPDWTTPGLRGWLWLGGVGVTMALAQFLLILAYEQASAAILSPFNYSVVIFSGLIGWLVWDQVPNALSLVGVALVCAGGVLATLQRHKATASLPIAPAPHSAT
jgi:drug/metabolite transporter (DMT)-like permease